MPSSAKKLSLKYQRPFSNSFSNSLCPQVTSSAKKQLVRGSGRLAQTPEGSFYDVIRNGADVLQRCGMAAPEVRVQRARGEQRLSSGRAALPRFFARPSIARFTPNERTFTPGLCSFFCRSAPRRRTWPAARPFSSSSTQPWARCGTWWRRRSAAAAWGSAPSWCSRYVAVSQDGQLLS